MVNGHLGWSNVMGVDQRSLGLNGVHIDTFKAVIHKKNIQIIIGKSPKFENCNSQLILKQMKYKITVSVAFYAL